VVGWLLLGVVLGVVEVNERGEIVMAKVGVIMFLLLGLLVSGCSGIAQQSNCALYGKNCPQKASTAISPTQKGH
jgi:hypothetical protein